MNTYMYNARVDITDGRSVGSNFTLKLTSDASSYEGASLLRNRHSACMHERVWLGTRLDRN